MIKHLLKTLIVLFIFQSVQSIADESTENMICATYRFDEATMYVFISSHEFEDDNGDLLYLSFTALEPIEYYEFDERVSINPETGEEPFILYCNQELMQDAETTELFYEYWPGTFRWSAKDY